MRLMTDPTVGPIEYMRNVGPELDERSCRWPEVGDPVSDGAGTRRADWGQPLRVGARGGGTPPPRGGGKRGPVPGLGRGNTLSSAPLTRRGRVRRYRTGNSLFP